MRPVRLFFEKIDSAIYISHLDLMRCFERCIRRAGVPIWYTEGFNPRPFLTFALPLSLGTASLREVVDLRLDSDMELGEVITHLNSCLPNGLRITDAAEPIKKPTAITASAYIIKLNATDDVQELCRLLEGFLSQESIIIKKLNKKKKEVEFDLKSHVKNYSVSCDGGTVILNITLSSGCTENCNPSLVLSTFFEQHAVEGVTHSILRTDILDDNMESFR